MGAAYTGNAAAGSRTPAIQITEPVDADPQAAATYNVAFEKLADYIAWLQDHAAIFDDFNTFSESQTVNGSVGDASGVFYTTAVPTARKLLWEIKLDGTGTPIYARMYSVNGAGGVTSALEFTVNAWWDVINTRWNHDGVGPYPVRYKLIANNAQSFEVDYFNNGAASFWTDAAWTGYARISPRGAAESGEVLEIGPFQVTTPASAMTLTTNGVLVDGSLDFGIGGGAVAAAGGDFVYGYASFRKGYVSAAPAAITYLSTVGSANIANGGVAGGYFLATTGKYGVAMWAVATVAGNATWHINANAV